MLWKTIDRNLKKKGWSLRKLADESGVNFETVRSYKYHHKEPSFRNVCKIADALHVSLDDFREGGDEDGRSYRSHSKNG